MVNNSDKLLVLASRLAEETEGSLWSPIKGRVAYIFGHDTGYKKDWLVAPHLVAKLLNNTGFEAICFAKTQRGDEAGISQSKSTEEYSDGVRYVFDIESAERESLTEDEHLQKEVHKYTTLFKVYRPQYVLSVSDYNIAIPALVAAEKLAIPFFTDARTVGNLEDWCLKKLDRLDLPLTLHHNRNAYAAQKSTALIALNESSVKGLSVYGIHDKKIAIWPRKSSLQNVLRNVENPVVNESSVLEPQTFFQKFFSLPGKMKESSYTLNSVVDTDKNDTGYSFFSEESKYAERNLIDILEIIEISTDSDEKKAAELTRLAKLASGIKNSLAVFLGRLAVKYSPRPFRKKWFGFLLFNSGFINESLEYLEPLIGKSNFSQSELYKYQYIKGCASLFNQPPKVEYDSGVVQSQLGSRKILYVASSSRPFHYNGYTSRTHGILKALTKKGWDVLCITRPGYPMDRDDRVHDEDVSFAIKLVDGVKYQALSGLHRRNVPLDQYIIDSSERIAAFANEWGASILHAASNYEAALPALLAARKINAKFLYEVRGLWEFTAASRIPGWEKTERFQLDKMLESLVTNNADSVATLTTAMADEIKERGRTDNEIKITPNAITPDDFSPVEKNTILVDKLKIKKNEFVIGYAGSIVSYEGLDDLILAVKKLIDIGHRVKALIVGDGKFLPNLKELAFNLGVSEHVMFVGRVKSEEVVDYLSVTDLVALPRKPFTVCELVSPLKPFEAMALKIPLIVSDVHALKEIARNETVAVIHRAGCSSDLATKIKHCIMNPELISQNKERAFHCVHKEHTWEKVSLTLSECYNELLTS